MGEQPSFSEQRRHDRGAFGAIIESLAGPPARKPLADRVAVAVAVTVIIIAALAITFGLAMSCLAIWNAVIR